MAEIDRAAATRTRRRDAETVRRRVAADVAVLGSGIAGISAALEVARLGRRVALIDAASQRGGESVGAMIGSFCGLYSAEAAPRQVTHGIADEILRDLRAAGDASDIVGRRRTIIVQYRIAALQRWIEEAVRKTDIELVLSAALSGVRSTGRRLEVLELATRYGPVEVTATGFVDASGDAALAWTAGLSVREPEQAIYGTLMFTLDGVDWAALASFDRAELAASLNAKAARFGLGREPCSVLAAAEACEVRGSISILEAPCVSIMLRS